MAVLIGVIGIALIILVPLAGYYVKLTKRINSSFSIIWEKTSRLKPEDILVERPYNNYYYKRNVDEYIVENLKNKKNLLLFGQPLSGKTRAVFQALKVLKAAEVLIPHCTDINLETFILPKSFKFWRRKIVFIDDLQRFVEIKNYDYLFRELIKSKYTVISTCRSGIELKIVEKKTQEKNLDIMGMFNSNVEILLIEDNEGKIIANKVGIEWSDVNFNGTIGSIFMRLGEMKKRCDECNEKEKAILGGIKLLYTAGIYIGGETYKTEWIKRVCKISQLELKEFEWQQYFKKLEDKEFIKIKENTVFCDETYCDQIFELMDSVPVIDQFYTLINTFQDEADVLFMIGNRSYDIGLFDLKKALWMKKAIKAYEEALKVRTLKEFPMDYGMTQNNLGNAYSRLAEVESKAENCKKAIKAYEEALKVRTLKEFPMDYGMTQNNLGNAYSTLAEVESKAENCKKAIKACEEALKVHTLKEFPMDYGMTQNNLGTAYKTLAEVESKAENCKKAIKTYEEALKVYNQQDFPDIYPLLKKNLEITVSFCSGC